MTPRRNRRPLLVLLAGIGILTVGGWVAASILGAYPDPAPASEIAQQPQLSPDPQSLAEPETDTGTAPRQSVETVIQPLGPGTITAKTVEPEIEQRTPSFENRKVPIAAVSTRNPHPDISSPPLQWTRYTIKSGDSLARIFKRHKLNTRDAIRIADHEDAGEITKLMPGRNLSFGHDQARNLRKVSFELKSNRSLVVAFAADGSLQFDDFQAEYDKRERTVSAEIKSSLFKAGLEARINDKMVLQLVNMFGWDIDFAQDLRKGDRFTVIYEELHDGDKIKGTGDILAAEFVNGDRKLTAFRHVSEQGGKEYFNAEGESLRGTFLRTPMKISRITSGFSKARLHPILNEWRAHNGVDYAAPRGTPILATADGRVGFLGRKNGYGKTIVLRHGGKYSTLYAHLSSYKSKLKPGSKIKQGQIIGFVGKTGMATAPHLHYEFRVHGEHRNPLTYRSPKADPIPDQHRPAFLAKAQQWMQAMSQHSAIQLAQNDTIQIR